MITDNREKITPCLYIVRTQAGFKQAAKEYWNNEERKPDVRGYPKKYPALVVFSDGYEGYWFVRANCYGLNFITTAIARHEREHASGQSDSGRNEPPEAGDVGTL